MNDPDYAHHPLTPLELPAAIRTQTGLLFVAIERAHDLSDLLRAADRAEGFVLGLETLDALPPMTLEKLYRVFGCAAQARQADLGR